jgi:hypothetical protein
MPFGLERALGRRTCPARRNGDTISAVQAGAHLSLAGALAFGLIIGCQASLNADANVSGEGAQGKAEADLEGSAEGTGEMAHAPSTASPGNALAGTSTTSVSSGSSRVLLGARHDLKLLPGKATANCECLSVALGGARSSGMAWGAVPPELDDRTQLSIALSSEGQICKGEPQKSLGASYWGYRLQGNDVVVLVEAALSGRPLTAGAVIPKPVGAGQVYVAPASRKLPYGRALEGKGMCKIGNPGQLRTSPFTELEVGNDVPARAAKGTLGGQPANSDQTSDETPMTVELPSGD